MVPIMLPWILHIDMDAFFASVEQLDNPELRGKPIAIGGSSDRGVVSTASYEARKFGVRSALSVVKARRLCPQLILIPGRMKRYKELSRLAMGVLQEFSPTVEQASVDEAYLDGTGLERLFGPIEEVGQRIRERMVEVTGLTCSVGAAPVRFLAKIASDMNKPDGMFIIRHNEVETFLHTLPVKKIPGVGQKAAATLERLGVRTCGDVRQKPKDHWEKRLGKQGECSTTGRAASITTASSYGPAQRVAARKTRFMKTPRTGNSSPSGFWPSPNGWAATCGGTITKAAP